MKKKFTVGKSLPAVTDLLAHHDLAFRAPVCGPTYGLPIGNGDSGALLRLDEVSFREDDPDHEPECCMGWRLMPVYLARMGLSELLAKQTKQTIFGWMRFPQGFGLYTPSDRAVISERFRRYRLTDMDSGKQTGERCGTAFFGFEEDYGL